MSFFLLPLTVPVIIEVPFLCARHQLPTTFKRRCATLSRCKSFVRGLAARVVWRSIRTFGTEGCLRWRDGLNGHAKVSAFFGVKR